MKSVQQPSFNLISSDLKLGAAIADISRGWDGTLWAIDTNGAPHIYDPLQGVWNPHGTGIDAAALVGDTIYHFRGPEVVTCKFDENKISAPTLISEMWPALPHSFQLGVHGAANVNGKLFLFGRGQFVCPNDPGPASPLDQLSEWPSTGGWAGGAIDGACSLNGDQVLLFRNGEYITISFSQGRVVTNPWPLSQYGPFHTVPPHFLEAGFTGGFFFGPDNSKMTIYNGPGLLSYVVAGSAPSPQYVAAAYSNWPANWNPQLAHAPSGRVGNLWAAMADSNGVVFHDGDQWNAIPGIATYAAVGSDNSVYTVGEGTALFQWQGGESWNQVSSPPQGATLAQVSVGDSRHIWARDTSNTVYALAGSGFSASPEVGQAAHLAANFDGTVWHCNNDANAYRFAQGTSASDGLAVPQGRVHKVASTGFGNSHCLTSDGNGQQLYEYTSAFAYRSAAGYLFNTSAEGQIAEGLGQVYFAHFNGGSTYPYAPDFQSYIVAVDTHSGQQVWETAVPWKNCYSTAPVFDPRLNLVYFGLAVVNSVDVTNPGVVVALDAKTGATVWEIQYPAEGNPGPFVSVDHAPALSGNVLAFGDRQGYLHAIDTDAALENKGGRALWSTLGFQNASRPLQTATPCLAGDLCYSYAYSSQDNAFYVQRCAASDGSALVSLRELGVTAGEEPELWPPVFGKGVFPADNPIPAGTYDALFIQACNEVHAINLAGPDLDSDQGYTIEPGFWFTTGFAYVNGTLWLGDSGGRLHAFNSSLSHVNGTPYQVSSGRRAVMSIAAHQDAAGNAAVFCTLNTGTDFGAPSLFAFDPANRVTETIDSGNSVIWALGAVDSNGMLPAGGMGLMGMGPVFGIRVDPVISSIRGFIVESQLMQDYDEPVPGASPTPVTRYQTHVTLVDNFKVPRAKETIKIWADKAGTAITVDGTSYTIGPDDASFASVQTGVDGAIVIVSNATQLYSTCLRLWAGFMDPCERISVCPDQEFHGRLLRAGCTSTNPSEINLATAHTYTQWKSDGNGGTTPVNTQPLLSGDQPGQVAGAIQRFGGASGVGQAPVCATGHHWFGGRLDAAPPKYSAYGDLPGMGYSAVNVALKRVAQAGNPTGFRFSTDSGVVAMSPAQAAAAIDAWTGGNDWQPATATLGSAYGLGGWWDDFWGWLSNTVEQVADAVADVIVSVAEDIYVGIQVIVNGVKTFFRAIVHTIEDAVKAIGSFFLKIGKLIKDVIEALSLLFHFEEILKVHNMLRNAINNGLTKSAAYLENYAQAAIDNAFSTAETDVVNAFAKWKALVQASPQSGSLSSLPTASSSPHTVLSASPNSGGPKQSCSVQGMWGIHKMKTNLHSAKLPTQQARLADSTDPLAAFVQNFLNSLETDSTLKAAYQSTLTDFKSSFNFSSLDQFAGGLLVDLIDILQDVVVTGLALTKAMLDGLVGAAAAVATDIGKILNYQIDIPVISSLYQMLTGNPLTLLDLGCLIVAIPVTLLYVVIDGDYPALDSSLEAVSDSVITARVTGLFTAIAYFPYMIISVMSDTETAMDLPSNPIVGNLGSAISTSMWVAAIPGFVEEASTNTNAWDTVGWAVGAPTPVLWAYSAMFPFSNTATWILNLVTGLASLGAYIVQRIEDQSSEDAAALTANVVSTLPNISAPLLAPGLAPSTLEATAALKILIDVFCNLISCCATVAETSEGWDTAYQRAAIAAAVY